MAQTLGIVTLTWQGTKIKVNQGSEVRFGGLEAKPVVTGTSIDYANEMKDGQVNATSVLTRGQQLLPIWALGAGELQVQCDTGQSYIWPDAVLSNTGNFNANGKGGAVKLQFIVGVPQEVLNG